MNSTHLIDPQNQSLWTVGAFAVALIALAVAFVAVHRTNALVLATQSQALALNKKIEDQGRRIDSAAKPAAAPAVAPAASASK